MTDFLTAYFAWAGPNTIAALAASAITWLLVTRKGAGRESARCLQTYLVVTGAAVITVAMVSAAAALLKVAPHQDWKAMLGVVSGIVPALLLRKRSDPPAG